MRRILLGPPRAILVDAPACDLSPPLRTAAAETGPTVDTAGVASRGSLDPPDRARERRRRLFRPRRGHVRRFQRRINNWLSATIYPRLPGLHLIYDGLLRRGLTLSEAQLEIAGLPPDFAGLRLLLLSDVHVGPFVSPGAMRRLFERLMLLEPDLVLLAGDLVTSRIVELEQHSEAFAALHAPLGVFAVLGNHDHYTGQAPRVRALVEAQGIRVLHNSSVALRRGAGSLTLAGIDDLLYGDADLERALSGTAPPVILMSHNPDVFFDAARREVDLVLSGHTHGGQIRIPGLPVLVRQSRYGLDEGRYRTGATELIVSRGVGAVGLPWRVSCPPEAVLLTLR